MENRLTSGGRGSFAVTALGVIVAVTVGWWGFALWPLSEAAPAWIERARFVCFGSTPTGLPDAGGWVLLVGQPVGMVLVLMAVWGDELDAGLRALGSRPVGRTLIAVTLLLVVGGIGLTGARLYDGDRAFDPGSMERMGELAPVDRVAPPFRLLDQRGDSLSLERFRGRPVFLSFAFAHCQTVCPTVVREILAVQAAAQPRPAVVIITLDPWRDHPARLPAISAAWKLGEDAFLLSGDVASVERTLDGWQVRRTRDDVTGEIRHQALVHLIDPNGVVAFSVAGYRPALERALEELRPR